jgi:hypothetical protein
VYSTYAFYTDNYHGSLSESEYNKYSHDAAFEIDRLTFGNATGAPQSMAERLSWAECKVIDLMAADGSVGLTELSGVSSVNNDGYGVSFQGDAAAAHRREIESTARKFLTFPVNLMYRGAFVHDNIRHRHNRIL